MRQRARLDRDHRAIGRALKQAGCSVYDTSRLGNGFPDLVVRTRTRVLKLVEVKSPGGQLTPAQETFLVYFPETLVVSSVDDALAAIGATR